MKAATLFLLVAAAVSSMGSTGAGAEPLHPRSAAEVVQVLDGAPNQPKAQRRAERGWQRRLQVQPRDEEAALALGQALLARARSEADARLGGRALAALQGFADGAAPPAAIALLRADIQQHLHAFAEATLGLQRLLARPRLEPALRTRAQLLLAQVQRTQGQLAASDNACQALNPEWLMRACRLEIATLRDPQLPLARWSELAAPRESATRAWLWVSRAEHAQRASQPEAAETALRQALALQDDPYTRCALADLLQAQARPAEALALLEGLPRGDAVAVRQAALARQLQDPRAPAWAHELRQRFAQARERHAADPREPLPHLREQAQFALQVEDAPRRALALAQANLRTQREPLDLLLLAQAARAAGQPQALQQAARLSQEIGVRDERLQALL